MLRQFLFGRALPTAQEKQERLPKILALPILASDALSSNAYATEEILLVLVLLGTIAHAYSVQVSAAICILLAIVAASYCQTVHAYPHGGGAYTVAKENLGELPGLSAGAALLIDYVLTVAVSVAAGVAAVISAFPSLLPYRIEICMVSIVVLTLINLRGVRESGAIFSIPTYLFLLSFGVLLIGGAVKVLTGAPHPAAVSAPVEQSVTLWLILRAFSGGCAALTGVEAISNSVPTFRPPESRNAAITLVLLAVISSVLFIGLTFLAKTYTIMPVEGGHETVVSQIARGTFGFGIMYVIIQAATAAILILAANTSYNGFPRLSSVLAQDGYLPKQFTHLGDRLVYANGIAVLGAISAAVIVLFHGSTHALIPLYAVGVFLSFTLSQFGMVRRSIKLKRPNWVFAVMMNATGGLATGVVLIVIAATKFSHGAWMVVVLIPVLVAAFRGIRAYYLRMSNLLSVRDWNYPTLHHTVLLLVPALHRGVLEAMAYARAISQDVRGVHIEVDRQNTERLIPLWEAWAHDVPLVILESPYRSVVGPLLDYIEEAKKERPDDKLTVVIPEFVPPNWWENIFHNQTGLVLKLALLFRRDVVVTNVRFHLESSL